MQNEEIVLRKAARAEKDDLYALVTTDEEWTKFNGPYFPYATPSPEKFAQNLLRRLCDGKQALLIEYQGQPVGAVTYYWEDERTRWLEVGVIIYDQAYWNRGIGRKALVAWITHLFETLEIERVGLTTWSGNPRMIACAKSIGMQLEARLRKVRYYQGVYYDSIKMGVLRDEWFGTYRELGAGDPVGKKQTVNLTWVFEQTTIDWDDLSHLYRVAPLGNKPAADLEIVFANSRFKCFVFDGATLIGVGRALADGLDCAYLCDIAVHPDYQGIGLGRKIVEALVEKSSGHKKIILYANPGKEGFYAKLGFKKMNTAMAIFQNETDMIRHGVLS